MIFNYEPDICQSEHIEVLKCLENGIASPYSIRLFENNITAYTGIEAISCSSGTAALHMSLIALGIGTGDEVICPAYTFAATWNAILYTGATPVFVDVCKDTWCLDVNKLRSKISNKTKAIISVDIFGNSCNYERLLAICKDYKLKLVQDCAESLGTKYNNKHVLTLGDISCTSFNLNKIITTGGGGAIFSSSSFIIEKINSLKNQSKIENSYDYNGIGYNYRMGSINAALGISQIKRINQILENKNKITLKYKELLSEIVVFQKIKDKVVTNNWLNVIKFVSEDQRNYVYKKMLESKIEVKLTFKPASNIKWLTEAFNIKKEEYKVSNNLYKSALSLPSSPNLMLNDVINISNLIKKYVSEYDQ